MKTGAPYQKAVSGVKLNAMMMHEEPFHSAGKTGRSALLSAVLIILGTLFFAGCANRDGWGLVLWTVKGTDIKAGSVVPIYLKSNIMKEYVIGAPDGSNQRYEVPLWQVERFSTRSKAAARAKEFGDLLHVYLIATRDGLPVREKPQNTAKRVYRLHENELVKALKMVEGEKVFTGSQELAGSWYEVLTMDGTKGYVFSNTMRLMDESQGEMLPVKAAQTNQELVSAIFARTWRPEYYAAMIENDTVDLDAFSLRFGLFADAINQQIRIELPQFSKVFQYSSITQDGSWIVFGSTDLRILLESADSLLVSWAPDSGTGDLAAPQKAASADSPTQPLEWRTGATAYRFLAISDDLRSLIRAEETRQSEALKTFFAAVSSFAPGLQAGSAVEFSSPDAGTLSLWPSGLFTWKGAGNLQAGFLPAELNDNTAVTGQAVFGLRLSDDIKLLFQGGFSLYPENGGKRSDYLYRLNSQGMILAKAVTPGTDVIITRVDKRLGTVALNFKYR